MDMILVKGEWVLKKSIFFSLSKTFDYQESSLYSSTVPSGFSSFPKIQIQPIGFTTMKQVNQVSCFIRL